MRSYKRLARLWIFYILSVATIIIILLNQASAVTENVLYSFQGGVDGNMPLAALMEDAFGNLYGTTFYGGLNNAGTVFKLAPPIEPGGAWTESILWSFLGRPNDGGYPTASLIMDKGGNLYGTTSLGGAYGTPYGYGTVFKLTPPAQAGGKWSESVLWSFGRGSDGTVPENGLIMDRSGNLYGVTYGGGSYGYNNFFGGTVFKLSPPSEPDGAWIESILWNFHSNATDGSDPLGGLVMDAGGNLYGTTLYGGTYGKLFSGGTVFELSPSLAYSGSWNESILWNFGNGADGRSPAGNLALDKSGNFFGTTEHGGLYSSPGTVFKLTPPALAGGSWTESILWNFVDVFGYASDAVNPMGLIMDSNGNLYGTTQFGGLDGNGAVFGLIPRSDAGNSWIESLVYNFNSPDDGQFAPGGVIADANGNLFGTNQYGGADNQGAVYEISNLSSLTDPEIGIKQQHILFPNTAIGSTSTVELGIRNIGSAQLTGTVDRPSRPFDLSGSGDFNLAPGAAATITLSFTPTSTISTRRITTVTSNAERRSSVQIHLQGTGTP